MTKNPVNLSGVPETTLWTLYNRAHEASRPDTILRDPDCVRIYESIVYDYERKFGKPSGAHAMRSRIFDDAVRPWLRAHPGGTVVELGAGLETQFQRCDDGCVRWLCVDLPETIAVRERFLPATDRCRHLSRSALDLSWLDEVDASHGVFVTAQGLFMYLAEADVRRLVCAVVDRLAGVELMFDTIPPWISQRTLAGTGRTRHYQVPPMPWGVAPDDLALLLRGWSPRVTSVTTQLYGHPRGLRRALVQIGARVPWMRGHSPAITHVKTTPEVGRKID